MFITFRIISDKPLILVQLLTLYAVDWIKGINIVSQPFESKFIKCPTKTFIGKQVSDTTYWTPSLIIVEVVLSDKIISNPRAEKNP